MYTIEEFLDNRNKIAIIKDGTPQYAKIAQELRDRNIYTLRIHDLDYDPFHSIIYGHGGTNYLQSASMQAVKKRRIYKHLSPRNHITPSHRFQLFAGAAIISCITTTINQDYIGQEPSMKRK